MEDRKFLSRKELAYEFRISLSSVDRGLKSNRFPFSRRVYIGKRVLFPISIIQDMTADTHPDSIINDQDPIKKGTSTDNLEARTETE